MSEQATQPEQKRYQPRERYITEIIADLKKSLPASVLKTKTLKGNQITYVPWYNTVKVLDYYAPGWMYEVRDVKQIGANCVVAVRITIPAKDGDFHREALGIEDDDKDGFGDPASNAESMALRRAAAKFGLNLELYNKK